MSPTADRARAEQVIAAARTFARDRVDPEAASWERDRRLPREAITAAAAAGLCGLLVPTELGGAGDEQGDEEREGELSEQFLSLFE